MLPLGAKGKLERIPWITFSIIAINVLLFLPRNYMPLDEYWDIARIICGGSAFGKLVLSCFMHADFWHIFGNMIFLWTFAPLLEDRMGRFKFALFYLVGGAIATLTHSFVMYMCWKDSGWGIGASGGVSAVMGAYAIRFYFRKIAITPFFSTFLPIKIRVSGLFFILFYAVNDLVNAIRLMDNQFTNVAHWAHVGGLAFGLTVAGIFKYHRKARMEKLVESMRESWENMENPGFVYDCAEIVLKFDPNNIEAMHILAQISSKFRPTPQGESWYRKAIETTAGDDPIQAAQLYAEYVFKYDGVFTFAVQRALSLNLIRLGKYSVAARGLELWLKLCPDDPKRATIYMDLAHIYAEYMDNKPMAIAILDQLLAEKSNAHWSMRAREKMEFYAAPSSPANARTIDDGIRNCA